MNPVGEAGNQFDSLFAKMPAKRVGSLEDVAGITLFLCSQAGVSSRACSNALLPLISAAHGMLTLCSVPSRTWMDDVSASMVEERYSQTANRTILMTICPLSPAFPNLSYAVAPAPQKSCPLVLIRTQRIKQKEDIYPL